MTQPYRQIFRDHCYATFLEDAAGVIVDANAAAARLLDCSREEIIGRHNREFLSAASLERVLPQRQNLKPDQRLQCDAQYVAKGGKLGNVILDICRLRPSDDAGEPGDLYLVIARECSKLDELERELRLQRQSAYTSYQNSQHALFFISARNEVSPYPPAASGEAARPLDWVHLLLPGPRLKPAVDRAWIGEEVLLPPAWYSPLEPSGPHDHRATTSVQVRWLKIGLIPLRARGLEVSDICVDVLDCTAERLGREEQRQIDQRVSAALLSSTLHHELNNYLSVILAQASGLRLAAAPGQLPPAPVGAIIDAAQNAATLLRQSGDMSHHGGAEMSEVELNTLAADCAHLLPHLARGRISVDVDLAADVPLVRGDAFALKAMLLDLLYYAESRVPQGGKLTVKTHRAKSVYPGMPPQTGIAIQDNTPPAGAVVQTPITVDAQAGATEESLQLALARTVLRQHQGQLEIVHSSTQGRVFAVTLPGIEQRPHLTEPKPLSAEGAADEELVTAQLAQISPDGASAEDALAATASAPAPNATKAHYRVLLADDEENFRAFSSWVLKENGYEVLVANDGLEAFERFQEAPQTFHLVILDAYMPRMGGLEAYLRMQVLRPDLPVLFASGFVRGASVDALVEGCPGPAGVLLKPFTSDDLLHAVQKALTRD